MYAQKFMDKTYETRELLEEQEEVAQNFCSRRKLSAEMGKSKKFYPNENFPKTFTQEATLCCCATKLLLKLITN